MAPRRPLTAFEKTIPDYRKRILISFARALIVPPLLTSLLLRIVGGSLSLFIYLPLALLSIPIAIGLRSQYSQWSQDREAASMGAKPITRVRGRWPGNLDIVLRLLKSFESGYVLQGFADLFAEYGCATLNTRFFWDDQIISMDEKVFRFVAHTGFTHFEKGILWHERIDKLLGTGLFNAEGNRWRIGRQIARPFFTKERISDLNIFDQTSAKTLNLIANRAAAYAPIDVQDLLQRFTLDSAALFLWGHALNTLDMPLTQPGRVVLGPKGSAPADGGSEWDEFTNAFETVAVLITRRGVQGDTWPLLELFKDKTEEPIQVIMDWLEPLVRQALDRKAKRVEASGGDAKVSSHDDETVFLDYLTDRSDDVEHIRYELVTFLIASRDTTSSLLTFVIYFLALHPDVCCRLRNEVLETFGTTGAPTYADLKTMNYLHAVLKETLRIFPSAPLVARTSCDGPLIIPNTNLYLPPKTQIMMSSLLAHKRTDLWGPDAEAFRPERWFEPALLDKIVHTPFMYSPFYGGPRICLGQEFALNQAGFFIVRLLQRFKSFTLAPDFMPAGSLPPAHWAGMPGRQGVEKIHPAINFTMHSKVRWLGNFFFALFCAEKPESGFYYY
ncbi:cytochrome P450 monooxygenase CYP63 [Russula ochroleuca]|uniref:Cytochrome P450 monooxygenase CYP63 n=1 Tax=Russula ochroleuca TaxID=152965 RepID=A0A9P5K048_9AGAM|nr:cytochrome P450 monooxygenase CYP63 [Russula ochroleuca]